MAQKTYTLYRRQHMIKHYGQNNKGFTKANRNRTERAIMRRVGAGEKCKTSPALCDLMDKAYGQMSTDREGFDLITRREFYGHKAKRS
jgi:hypothetical protein